LALDDIAGEIAQRVCVVAEARQCLEPVGKQRVRRCASALKTEQADVGRFARGGVFAAGFAQSGRAAFHVQNVVNHLESQAEMFAEYLKRCLLFLRGARCNGAETE